LICSLENLLLSRAALAGPPATILNGSMFKQGLDNAFAIQTDPSYRFDGAAIVDEQMAD
jgi:hypothetical protein